MFVSSSSVVLIVSTYKNFSDHLLYHPSFFFLTGLGAEHSFWHLHPDLSPAAGRAGTLSTQLPSQAPCDGRQVPPSGVFRAENKLPCSSVDAPASP